jgi:hypothetical protein
MNYELVNFQIAVFGKGLVEAIPKSWVASADFYRQILISILKIQGWWEYIAPGVNGLWIDSILA